MKTEEGNVRDSQIAEFFNDYFNSVGRKPAWRIGSDEDCYSK